MSLDVTDLREFYASPLGQAARRLLAHRIRSRWRSIPGETFIGLGYASPYLGAYRADSRRLGALMPAGQGALVWPPAGPVHTVLVEDDRLPLPDNCVDRMLCVHCLEAADRPAPLLREIWRVLAPEGRLLMVVPNRRGVWARTDATPFGHGRPYSRGQLERLLQDALFAPSDWSSALHFPPSGRPVLLKSALAWERIGSRLGLAFAGVIIVEARKEISAPLGKTVRSNAMRDLVTAGGKPVIVEGAKSRACASVRCDGDT